MQISLNDALLSDVDFAKIGEYEVGYIQGQVVPDQNVTMLAPLPQAASAQQNMDPDAQEVVESAADSSEPPPGHEVIFVGDIKLSEFRQVLVKAGLQVLLAIFYL